MNGNTVFVWSIFFMSICNSISIILLALKALR